MAEIESTPFQSVKTIHGTTVSVRYRIENFIGVQEQEELFDIRLDLLPSNKSAYLALYAFSYIDHENDDLVPSFWIDHDVKDYSGKFWIENLAGRKCSEVSFAKGEHNDDNGDGVLIHHINFNFDDVDLNNFLIDNIGIMCFELNYRVSEEDYIQPTIDLDFRRKLWQDRNTDISDLILKVENKQIKASKAVLAAQSKVFKCMLLNNSIEAKTGVVEITDATYEAVEAFVEFLYLDSTEKFESLVEQLYVLADMYDVPLLKSHCIKRLNETITDENAFDRLMSAFYYSDKELKKPALDHVVDKRNAFNYTALMSSPKWLELGTKNPKLKEEIWNAISNMISV